MRRRQRGRRPGGEKVRPHRRGPEQCRLQPARQLRGAENQDIERQFATNFWGVMYVMRAALPVMRKQRSGHFINMSSVAGVVGLKHCSAYGASKFAVEGLSLAVAEEVEKFGIKVTVVEPGFFRTDLLAAANVKWPSNRIDDYAAAEVAPRRCGLPTLASSRAIPRSSARSW